MEKIPPPAGQGIFTISIKYACMKKSWQTLQIPCYGCLLHHHKIVKGCSTCRETNACHTTGCMHGSTRVIQQTPTPQTDLTIPAYRATSPTASYKTWVKTKQFLSFHRYSSSSPLKRSFISSPRFASFSRRDSSP